MHLSISLIMQSRKICSLFLFLFLSLDLFAASSAKIYLEPLSTIHSNKQIAEHFLQWAPILRASSDPNMPHAKTVAKIDLRQRLYGIAGYSDSAVVSHNTPFITTPYLLVLRNKENFEKKPWNLIDFFFAPDKNELSNFLSISEEVPQKASQAKTPRIVGYCMLTQRREPCNTIVLFTLYIHPKMRRKGYGEAAMQSIKAHAKSQKYKNLSLEVYEHNPQAKALYKKAGFRCIHTEQCDNPYVVSHRMECRL